MLKLSVMLNINKKVKEAFEWLLVVVVAFIVAFLINSFILTNSFIPTPSMETNLPVGSRLFGFRLYYLFTDVKRGDVVIFDYGYLCKNDDQMYQKNDDHCCPLCGRDDKKNTKVQYIKRVIGLPGDHVVIKAEYTAEQELFRNLKFPDPNIKATCGYVYVNGEKLVEPYLSEPMVVNNFYKPVDVIVPENSYFLLGDNRNNSEDSRFWVKMFLDKKDILAKALLVYWPLNKIGIIK